MFFIVYIDKIIYVILAILSYRTFTILQDSIHHSYTEDITGAILYWMASLLIVNL